jgi:hypothetical protein
MAITASTMKALVVHINEMFANPQLYQSDQIQPAMTARALFGRQTAQVHERLVNGACVGVEAWYVDTTDVGEVSAPSGCTTPGGNTVSTAKVDYQSGVLARAAGNVDSNYCANELTFVRASGDVLRKIMSDLRAQLNVEAINLLDANSGANIYDLLPDTWTENGVTIEVPKTEMNWENLGYMQLVAENNNFPGAFFVSGGSNFWGEWWKSNYRQFNDNERGIFRAFQDMGFYFDSRQLDQTLGTASTFAVSPNAYAFWNSTKYGQVPMEVSVGSNGKKFVYSMPDPELMWMRNGVATPVMYEIEMEMACSSRDALDYLVTNVKYYGRVVGGLEMAPAGANGETGVIQFVGVSGI